MATFANLTGIPSTEEFEEWAFDVRWPARHFYDDSRMRRTDPDWLDYRGTMTHAELREFRDAHGLVGQDEMIDDVLESGWTGLVVIRCAEWEGY